MNTNLFPAILLAGPPNCGKSVLAFLLTNHLRELGIAHYLLRAAPDGEGNWFLEGQPKVVQTLRAVHKRSFSAEFIAHMHSSILARPLPLLVDIGGKPQGEQLNLLRACTHSILLYRTEEERLYWQKMLNDARLTPLAELRSTLTESDSIEVHEPVLRGRITGLDRDIAVRKIGMVFGVLLERVANICKYDAEALEQIHLKHAPFTIVNERDLAKSLSVPVEGERTIWSPSHLARLTEYVPVSRPLAIYGRGPVWLAAALAALTLPDTFSIFDARYGWLLPPQLNFRESEVDAEVTVLPYQNLDSWVEIRLPGGTLEPYEVNLHPIPPQGGVVLSGKVPRWLFAALVHNLAPRHDWLAVDDPRLSRAVIVHSNTSAYRRGDTLPRLELPPPPDK